MNHFTYWNAIFDIIWFTAYFVDGPDIGKFTMKTVDDIRTMNKNVHFRPSSNLYDINGLASLWEKKIGRTLPKVTITENDLLTMAAGPFYLVPSHSTVLTFEQKAHYYQFALTFRFLNCREPYTRKYCSLVHSWYLHQRLSNQLPHWRSEWCWYRHSLPWRVF